MQMQVHPARYLRSVGHNILDKFSSFLIGQWREPFANFVQAHKEVKKFFDMASSYRKYFESEQWRAFDYYSDSLLKACSCYIEANSQESEDDGWNCHWEWTVKPARPSELDEAMSHIHDHRGLMVDLVELGSYELERIRFFEANKKSPNDRESLPGNCDSLFVGRMQQSACSIQKAKATWQVYIDLKHNLDCLYDKKPRHIHRDHQDNLRLIEQQRIETRAFVQGLRSYYSTFIRSESWFNPIDFNLLRQQIVRGGRRLNEILAPNL